MGAKRAYASWTCLPGASHGGVGDYPTPNIVEVKSAVEKALRDHVEHSGCDAFFDKDWDGSDIIVVELRHQRACAIFVLVPRRGER